MTFRNQHLSYSRIDCYARCPRAFACRYVRPVVEPGNDALRLGTAVHATLEQLYREVLEQEQTVRLSETRALELFREAFGKSGATAQEPFEDGAAMLRRFVSEAGEVSHWDVLGVEIPFELRVGRWPLVGYIDRADRVDAMTVEVIDYKTSRTLFSRDEVESSLQLSVYAEAARRLWPWAKQVRLSFAMLRHGITLRTERTPEQVETALQYIEAVAEQIERDEEWAPRLNANCCYCGCRSDCPAVLEAQRGGELATVDPSDLAAVAAERERLALVAKLVGARKSELEAVLKERLKDEDSLDLGGVQYRMLQIESRTYPLEPTVQLLAKKTGLELDALRSRLATVDKDALDKVIAEQIKQKPKQKMVKTELDAIAEVAYSSRFWAKAAAR